MISDKYYEAYLRLACGIFNTHPTNKKIIKLVKVSKLTTDNLVISIFLLHRLKHNSIISIDKKLIDKIIIVSLILSNKLLQDSNYSFKTWIKLFSSVKININLKLLNQLEVLVLTGLNYHLDYKFVQYDEQFWTHLKQINFYHYKLFNDYMNHRPVDSPITPLDSPILQGNKTDFDYVTVAGTKTEFAPLDAIPQLNTLAVPALQLSNTSSSAPSSTVSSWAPLTLPMPQAQAPVATNYDYNDLMSSIPVALKFCNNYS